MRHQVFLSAALSTASQLTRNEIFALAIQHYCTVYLPQRDGGLLVDLIEKGCDWQSGAAKVFRTDMKALAHAKLVVALLDESPIGGGVSFEIGYAYARSIPIWVIRAEKRNGFRSPILESAISREFPDLATLLKELAGFSFS